MYSNKFTFGKKERLCSRKAISGLFEKGHSFYSPPFRVLWMVSVDDQHYPVRTGISAGKKSIPRAVDRNRVKRLVRETWRMNKHILYRQLEQLDMKLVIMIIYSGNTVPEYRDIEAGMNKLVRNFSLHLARFSAGKKT